jgi:hypothetical protein
MYKDLKVRFWWEKMREDIAEYVARCNTCQRVKAEHHSMAHALALDSRTWPREDVPGLGLIDEDVDLLRGVYVTSRPKA